ncbi:MAG: hypothetical protein ACHQQS_17780, partial [Thermoanaerobaculales bacterium]
MTLRSIRRVQHGSLLVLSTVMAVGLVVLGRFSPSPGQGMPTPANGISASQPRLARGAALLTAGNAAFCVPTSAHSTGAKGTNWRTDLEVHNPGSVQAAYTVGLLKRDTDNTNPAVVSFMLAPGLSQRYT